MFSQTGSICIWGWKTVRVSQRSPGRLMLWLRNCRCSDAELLMIHGGCWDAQKGTWVNVHLSHWTSSQGGLLTSGPWQPQSRGSEWLTDLTGLQLNPAGSVGSSAMLRGSGGGGAGDLRLMRHRQCLNGSQQKQKSSRKGDGSMLRASCVMFIRLNKKVKKSGPGLKEFTASSKT